MRRLAALTLTTAFAFALAGDAFGVDGVIEINEARAAAGGVTPADQPGYPVTLDTSGSYRLTSNLTVSGDPATTSAIIVLASSNVTIDLNGFTILGSTFCTGIPASSCEPAGTAMGIRAEARQAITIRNGIIRGFPDRGLLTAGGALIEDVVVSSNGGNGIQVGNGSIVRNCRAEQNGNDGIAAGALVIIDGNTSDANGGVGIRASTSSAVRNNTAASNASGGFVAFAGSNLKGNIASNNTGIGISAPNGVLAVGNTATGNTGTGLQLGNNSGYTQTVLTNNNGGDANAQVSGGIDLGSNICGAPGMGNGVACP